MSQKTLLDTTLQTIAASDWELFVSIIGPDAIINAKACLLRAEGKSYGQISVQLGINYKKAENTTRKCYCTKEDQGD